jgi:hypothetical protein
MRSTDFLTPLEESVYGFSKGFRLASISDEFRIYYTLGSKKPLSVKLCG